jgi:hypothetical protein
MKKVKWLLQSSGVKRNLHNEIWFSQNVDFIDFGLIPFTNEITNLSTIYQDWLDNENRAYIIRGSTKLLKILPTDALMDNVDELNLYTKRNNENYTDFFSTLKNSLFYDYEKFDQAYYLNLDLPLLNKGAISVDAQEAKHMQFSENRFVKPTSDGKAFVAGILTPGQTIEQLILSKNHHQTVWDETILIAPEKKVLKEWRFFVLNGEIITGSQYCDNHQTKVEELNLTKKHIDALACAKEYAKLYQPSQLFTLDICLEENKDWSIVEYNCFNCSGLYKASLPILKNVVEDFVSNRIQHTYGHKKI